MPQRQMPLNCLNWKRIEITTVYNGTNVSLNDGNKYGNKTKKPTSVLDVKNKVTQHV